MFELGDIFRIEIKKVGYISEIFSQGFNYHTLDEKGNCIKGQIYMSNDEFVLSEISLA
tara:strand:+ start:469 stop:642 length:174 start_codon:yes stop_codon:yes gene_type:complete